MGMEQLFAGMGEKQFRARQVLKWIHRRGAADFAAMSDIAKELRVKLNASAAIEPPLVVGDGTAPDGTRKWLLKVDGANAVEAVFIPEYGRGTLCVSSQAGCTLDCEFCATGKFPFGRNLKAHEIVEQAIDAERVLGQEGRRLSHVVFMGMGEPMANYRAVVDSVRRLADPDLLGMSPRRIVVSTAGLVPRIGRLAEEGLPVTLAISLHAARDELRDRLVPINRKYPVQQLVDAAQAYGETTGRRVSYEWVMLAGVNDSERDAHELGALLRGKLAHVNLIPFNPVDDTPFHAPDRASIRAFKEKVEAQGLNVTVRDTRGREADAACGQLHERVMRARIPA